MKKMISLLLLLLVLVLGVGCGIQKNDNILINMDNFKGPGILVLSDKYEHSINSEGVLYMINEISSFTYDDADKLIAYEIKYECENEEIAGKYLSFLEGIDDEITNNIPGTELGYTYKLDGNIVVETFDSAKVLKQSEIFTKEYVIELYKEITKPVLDGGKKHLTKLVFDDKVIDIE